MDLPENGSKKGFSNQRIFLNRDILEISVLHFEGFCRKLFLNNLKEYKYFFFNVRKGDQFRKNNYCSFLYRFMTKLSD